MRQYVDLSGLLRRGNLRIQWHQEDCQEIVGKIVGKGDKGEDVELTIGIAKLMFLTRQAVVMPQISGSQRQA